ncbi:MAG: NADH-quinone oxidoreductase subunit C [Coriobacteriia bacterium]|nr:NADH-quinone oxidoreductase subunit C [Coriobacteriia bacterium]
MTLEELRDHLCTEFPGLCPLFSIEFGDGVLQVDRDRLRAACADLKSLGFDLLGLVTAVDFGEEFELVYRVRSREMHIGIFVKTRIPRAEPSIESVVDLWPAADWHEREVYDLFGVEFEGHPNLKRILLTDDWVGHPLRKDYEDDTIIRRPDYL